MKSAVKAAVKALCLTLALASVSICSSAHAAPAKNVVAEQVSPAAAKNGQKSPAGKLSDAKPAAQDDGVVSINTASAEQLAQALNGVGLKKAQSIISYREEYGPFKEVDQMQEVPGIGSALVERNRGRIKL